MKFFCEYCGCRINADVEKKCPECGAAYDNNVTFKKLQEERKVSKEKMTKAGKTVMGVFAVQWIFTAIISLLIFSVIGFLIFKQIKNIKEPNSTSINKNDKIVEVNLGEYAKTNKYQVMVTGYEKDDSIHFDENEGYEYIKFNLQVENLTDKQIRSEEVNCIVDGVAQTNDTYSGHSTLPFFISSKLTVKGEAVFEVPVSATAYDIKYGDNVIIHIEK